MATFAPCAFALDAGERHALRDDHIGRALDRLFDADRETLMTNLVLATAERFHVSFEELHNHSTTVKFTGQYAKAKGRSIRGKRAPFVTFGHSKDHRPDLKQLLLILTTTNDGAVPVQFRCEGGNQTDVTTHIATWEALCRVAGTRYFYVADSKLCSRAAMDTKFVRKTKTRWRITWKIDQDKVAYDQKSDGQHPLISNDKKMAAAEVLKAHKRQPMIERRFEAVKSVYELAPLFLKNEGRIEALFFLYFVALLVQALIERELRRAMQREKIESLPLYPEERHDRRPTAEQIFRLYALLQRNVLTDGDRALKVFEPRVDRPAEAGAAAARSARIGLQAGPLSCAEING